MDTEVNRIWTQQVKCVSCLCKVDMVDGTACTVNFLIRRWSLNDYRAQTGRFQHFIQYI